MHAFRNEDRYIGVWWTKLVCFVGDCETVREFQKLLVIICYQIRRQIKALLPSMERREEKKRYIHLNNRSATRGTSQRAKCFNRQSETDQEQDKVGESRKSQHLGGWAYCAVTVGPTICFSGIWAYLWTEHWDLEFLEQKLKIYEAIWLKNWLVHIGDQMEMCWSQWLSQWCTQQQSMHCQYGIEVITQAKLTLN